ncbi:MULTISPECIES: hypothetical protein [Paenibacillus]|uniref:hypothetical protein n=1 Tax=Paenibacillus TaxID=44249 RepID=UPI00201E35C5|nr:hypothetical protein [Paenibacillus amylolyticus]MCL6663467.1 hypothetical protein [Paenibacillus amylolyticus]
MPPNLPPSQHDRPQRQFRSTRVRYDEQKIVHERESAGQTMSKQPKEKAAAVKNDTTNGILMLFLILTLSLVSFALIRQYHVSEPDLVPAQQTVSPGLPVAIPGED